MPCEGKDDVVHSLKYGWRRVHALQIQIKIARAIRKGRI